MTADQLTRLADVADKYASSFIHFTTREDAQLYYLELENAPALLRSLNDVGITTREACGNTVRNITTAANLTGTTGTAGIIGILNASTTAPLTLSQNTVYALANTNATVATQVVGIHNAGPTSGTNVIARNQVYNLAVSSSSATATIHGMNHSSGVATYQNNVVRLGYSADGSASLTNNIIINGFNEVFFPSHL